MTVAVGVDYSPQLRPVRKLQIPTLFAADTSRDELVGARDKLKKVNFLDVATKSPRRRKQPQRDDLVQRLVAAEERKIAEHSPASTSQQRPRCGIQLTVAGVPASVPRSENCDRTLARRATAEVCATTTTTPPQQIATLSYSDADRRLVEQFRRGRAIPRPRPLAHLVLLNPLPTIRLPVAEDPPLRASFLKRKTPPPSIACPSAAQVVERPTLARPPVTSRVHLPKKMGRADFGVVLRRPGSKHQRNVVPSVPVSTEKKPWVPKWRRVEVEPLEDIAALRWVFEHRLRSKISASSVSDQFQFSFSSVPVQLSFSSVPGQFQFRFGSVRADTDHVVTVRREIVKRMKMKTQTRDETDQ